MAAIKPGDKFYAKRTVTNQNCGITPGDQGYVTFVRNQDVSFYLERRGAGGFMEAMCPLGVFASNFVIDWRMAGLNVTDLADGGMGASFNRTYAGAKPNTKRFPDSFR